MNLFNKIGLKLFGGLMSVQPAVQAFVDGLANDPANFTVVIDGSATYLEVTEHVGDLAAQGVRIRFQRDAKHMTVRMRSYALDNVPLNLKEGKLLAQAVADWFTEGEFAGMGMKDGTAALARIR